MPPLLPHLIIFNILGVNVCRKSDCKKRSLFNILTKCVSTFHYLTNTIPLSILHPLNEEILNLSC